MNWQTKKVRDWLDEAGILNTERENFVKLQELVKSRLLVVGEKIGYTDYLKNVAMKEFLNHVEWKELVYNRSAWDDWGIDYYEKIEEDET